MMRKQLFHLAAASAIFVFAIASVNAKDVKTEKKDASQSAQQVQGVLKVNKERKSAAITTKKGIVTFEGIDLAAMGPLDGKTVTVKYEIAGGKKIVKEIKEPNAAGTAAKPEEGDSGKIAIPLPDPGKEADAKDGDAQAALEKVL